MIGWQRRSGRRDLPWQGTRDPYRIWLSEVMLQQTRVATVIPYYRRFLARFPDVRALASAPLDEVLRLWSGLGYYSRARNLHRAAGEVAQRLGGRFPTDAPALAALPGVGRSTAAAISAFSSGAREAILDGNVRRVLARCFAVEAGAGNGALDKALWELAESLLPAGEVAAYTQGLMDLGATVCARARPLCARCPVRRQCLALEAGRVEDFPARRAKKPLPLRRTVMLVLARRGKVLLHRRAPSGIWGGLWSLPEFPSKRLALAHGAADYGAVAVAPCRELAPFVHAFTHYRLRISPVLCRACMPGASGGQAGRAWFAWDEALESSISSPVRRLLQRARAIVDS